MHCSIANSLSNRCSIILALLKIPFPASIALFSNSYFLPRWTIFYWTRFTIIDANILLSVCHVIEFRQHSTYCLTIEYNICYSVYLPRTLSGFDVWKSDMSIFSGTPFKYLRVYHRHLIITECLFISFYIKRWRFSVS